MYRANWFLSHMQCLQKIPSRKKYALYIAYPWFGIYGTFSGAGTFSSLVRIIWIDNQTSHSPNNAKCVSSITSSTIYSTSDGSTCSSNVPSLNNRCLTTYVVIIYHHSRAYSSIRVSPLRKSWWVKMMHPASILYILFISWQRTTAF